MSQKQRIREGLLTLPQAMALDSPTVSRLYAEHVNPGLMTLYRALGLHDLDIIKAEGARLHLRDGRVILDFSTAFGVAGLGHNHPRILAAESLVAEARLVDALKVAPQKLEAALAHNLAHMMPDPLKVSFFAVSGAEAVEAALKLCERVQRGTGRDRFVTAAGSYHGRTHGTLAVTTSGQYREGFILSVPEANILEAPYGDVGGLKDLLAANRLPSGESRIIALILEPIQGQAVVVPSPGYLKEAARLCHEQGILVIFDEIKVGMCRTGPFCSFFDEAVIPDVVTLSKALGGGRRAISAMITSRKLFDKAYGSLKNCALHGATFGGLGSSCAVAIEAVNVMAEPGFQDTVRSRGEYARAKLLAIQRKHSSEIREIRGRGLFLGVRFDFKKHVFEKVLDVSRVPVFRTIESILIASVVRALYAEHAVLTHFSPSDPDVLHMMPPLTVGEEELDRFADALDHVVSRGLGHVVSRFLTDNLRSVLD